MNENLRYNSDFNGTGTMEKCLEEITYEEWLIELEKRKNIEYLNLIDRCPSLTFFVVRESDNKIIGMINVRYNIKDELLKTWASHIGYGIRPTERHKGYAKVALFLALLEEEKLKEEKVLLCCDVENIGSNKTILALGGKLEKTEFCKYDDTMTNYYWIDVANTVKKYYGYYKNYISEKYR